MIEKRCRLTCDGEDKLLCLAICCLRDPKSSQVLVRFDEDIIDRDLFAHELLFRSNDDLVQGQCFARYSRYDAGEDDFIPDARHLHRDFYVQRR